MRPRGNQAEEKAQRPDCGEELVDPCLCGSVVGASGHEGLAGLGSQNRLCTSARPCAADFSISENQRRPSLVQSHPPIPTVSPSAMACRHAVKEVRV